MLGSLEMFILCSLYLCCDILGSHNVVAEDASLLRCDNVALGG